VPASKHAAPGPSDISSTPDSGPSQPVLRCYPVAEKAGRKRSFRPDWYNTYLWLEYSQACDAAFCFGCRHFPSFGKDAEPAFTSLGFRTWKKAHYSDSGFPKHAKCDFHVTAMVMWSEYKAMKVCNSGSVLQMQSEAYAKQVSENRHYIKTVAEVLLLTVTQNIAQRGHREHNLCAGDNPGNFRRIFELVVRHDSTLSSRFSDGSRVTRYTSKDIQNEIISTMADMVREQILEEVKESVYFSVLVDETKDVSKKEQLSFVIRFFANKQINECFVDFKPAEGLDAKSLSVVILRTLQTHGLDVRSGLVGQGYDGASVMSGTNKGVQTLVRESAPFALYTHCYAHKLNLVLVDSCKSVAEATDFFALLERLYVFTSNSVMHQNWCDVQKELYPNEPPRQLQRLSDTRWACRVAACRNVRDRLDAVVVMLEDTAETSSDRAIEARGLLSLIDFKFVLFLLLFCDILGQIHSVSMQLQSSTLDLSAAVDIAKNFVNCLKERRQADNSADSLYSAAEDLCRKCNIEAKSMQPCVRKLPRRLSVSVVTQTVGNRVAISNSETFRIHCYLPIMDCVIAELESRFSHQASSVMLGIQALTPKHPSFLDFEKVKGFATLYNGNIEDIGHELYQLQRLLQRSAQTNLSSLLELACFLESYKLAFQEVYRLLNIALVLPVTSVACERSFSSLKLIKTYLRSTMCDNRLSSLAILSVESARSQAINLNSFVDEFDAKHNNRKLALH